MSPFILSLVRHLLTLAAGGLIGVGISEDDASNLARAAEPVASGIVIYVISQAWSWFDKRKK